MGVYSKKDFKRINVDINKLVNVNSNITNSIIFRYNDIILKKYWWYTDYAIDEEVFELLSNVNNKHLIKLYDMFIIIDDVDYFKEYNKFLSGKYSSFIDGYTAKYYQNDIDNPLLEKTHFLLQNIEELKELFDIIAKKHIVMKDVKVENSIIRKEGIVIIDPDYYEFSDLSEKIIKRKNYKELFNLIKTIFDRYYIDKNEQLKSYFKELNNINALDAIEQIEKRLKKVKSPICLFK